MTIEIPEPQWAVVEIMGHRTRAGAISDVQKGGATMLMIEHPTAADHGGADPLCEFYGGAAIFSIVPCTRDEAARVAGWAWPDPRSLSRRALGPGRLDPQDDDYYEECEDCHEATLGPDDHKCPNPLCPSHEQIVDAHICAGDPCGTPGHTEAELPEGWADSLEAARAKTREAAAAGDVDGAFEAMRDHFDRPV